MKSSDSTSSSTLDMNTDSRHESPAFLERVKPEKRDTSVSKEERDDIPSSPAEKKEEFAVPMITPSLHRRKNKKPNKTFVAPTDKSETENVDKTETVESPADKESQQGRKRMGSDEEKDAPQEQNKETEENHVSYGFLFAPQYLDPST